MIIEEYLTIAERQFRRVYSDEGRYVVRDGCEYVEAVDPIEFSAERIYTEGDMMPSEEIKMEEAGEEWPTI